MIGVFYEFSALLAHRGKAYSRQGGIVKGVFLHHKNLSLFPGLSDQQVF